MPDKLRLVIACGDYGHVRPLRDGAVGIKDCSLEFVGLNPGEMFARAFDDPQFDVAELSLANYISRRIQGRCDYVAIPAYVSRSFRHGNLFVHAERGIRTPQDLRGRRIGIGGYHHTAYTWLRGLLQDDYGVSPGEITWVSTRHVSHGGPADESFQPPAGVRLEWVDTETTLPQLLERGEIDAMAATRPPASPLITRLFADHRAVEAEYYRRTGILPILHLIGVRERLIERHPWLPERLFEAFTKAKMRTLADGNLSPEIARLRALAGDDYPRYGLGEPECATLDTFLRYHFDHGLASRHCSIAELFAPVPLSRYAA